MLTNIYLKRGDTLLGTLRVVGAEHPWTLCEFEPQPPFEEVRPLFEHEIALLDANDMSAWAEAYQQIAHLNLRLIDASSGNDVGDGDFLLHIRGNEARLRY
jgi:hypothetical protein